MWRLVFWPGLMQQSFFCQRLIETVYEKIAEPAGGANGEEPFSSVSIAKSVAAHPRRSPR